MEERTLILVKPDGVQRGLIGEIIGRFERRGLKLIGMKFIHMSQELAETHYGIHKERPFYSDLINYIRSGPVVAMVWTGKNAVEAARGTIGATNPVAASAGTIRGDLGMEIGRNLVHGSDSPENGIKEAGYFFAESELVDWNRDLDSWIRE
ncbi:MAG: nucleoside-diphosphate kinase [Anaerolineae bacterium]|nr:nucleoside-diphosphate kinase [Anaerolineae bacterium]MCO5187795.1 nucleoside-diphosphate kinase [Anaerolineae bacterium]MCO5191892.1 nucleoside-diphosphate kinase [Anaerolineae bacterium]MCO5197710.1 nucleoside-diphosphate kinase [Anaerolineae bacterium]MCO5206635.1 nucleoside-diphosphate kinase [Anaerolineae bacterium]